MDSESHDKLKYTSVCVHELLFKVSLKSRSNTELHTNSVVDPRLPLCFTYFNIFSKIPIFVVSSETSKRHREICRSTRTNYRPIRDSPLVSEKGNLDTWIDPE
jgi:hypothetical protein